MKYGVPEDFEYDLARALEDISQVGNREITRIRTFEDAGMMTMNAGIILEMEDVTVTLTVNHYEGKWSEEEEDE